MKKHTTALFMLAILAAATPAKAQEAPFYFEDTQESQEIQNHETQRQERPVTIYREVTPQVYETNSAELAANGCGPNGKQDYRSGTYEIECSRYSTQEQLESGYDADSCIGPFNQRASRVYGNNKQIYVCSSDGLAMQMALNENYDTPNMRNEYQDYGECTRAPQSLSIYGILQSCRDSLNGTNTLVYTPTYRAEKPRVIPQPRNSR